MKANTSIGQGNNHALLNGILLKRNNATLIGCPLPLAARHANINRGSHCNLSILVKSSHCEVFHIRKQQAANHNPTEEPEFDFSVVIALLNHGGHWEESIRSWAREQNYPRDKYEVIVVSNGKRAYEADVKKVLQEHDTLLICDHEAELDVYDYGLRKARGKVLFLAEAHSVGNPDCLTEMMNYLKESGRPGAMCDSYGAWKSYVGGLQEDVFQDENAIFGAGDHWHRIALRGTAILKSVYLQFGGFPRRYSMFGDRWFDIELFRNDVRLGFAHKSQVKHYNVSGYAHLDFSVRLFTYGECEYREDFSDSHCEKYIGPSKPWRERFLYHPAIAQLRYIALKKTVAQRIFHRALLKSAITAIPALINAKIISTFHARWPRLIALLNTQLWQLSTQILYWTRSKKLARQAFQQYFQSKLVDFYRYDYICKNPPKISCSPRLSFPMYSDLDDHLIDFHSMEKTEDGKYFRWTHPTSVINTKLPAGNYVLELEDAGCRPIHLEPNLAIFFNEHKLESLPRQQEEKVLRFKVDRQHFSASEFQHLILISDCFKPSRYGSVDTRSLGIPIAKVELHPIVAKGASLQEISEAQMVSPS